MSTESQELRYRLDMAYSRQATAKTACFDAIEVVTHAKRDLKLARHRILAENAADPKSLGSNEAAREATIAAMTADLTTALESAEDQERRARNALELASDEVSAARAILRVYEVMATDREEVRA